MAIQIQDLKRSHDFLDILFNNINSALFIIDDQMRVQEFNNAFVNMFGIIRDEVQDHLCGNTLGCVYTNQNNENCGSTKYCEMCQIRIAVNSALGDKVSATELLIERNFYIKGAYIQKYFQFACKPLHFEGVYLALLIVDDVTEKELKNQDLLRQNQIIKQYNNKFKDELILAQKIQKDLIPKKLPKDQDIHFVAKYVSMDEIGGDLYDVFRIDDDRIGFYVCDVTGHGIPAALITVMMKVIVEESTQLKGFPSAMVSHINEKLINIFNDVYLTLFYGVYDKRNKQLTYVRAGHPEPILIRLGSFMSLMNHDNFLLGFDALIVFKESHIQLEAGDQLILFTDGVFEARNNQGEMFESHLYTSLCSEAKKDISNCVYDLYKQLKAFVGKEEFDDDVCIMGVEVQ